MSVIGPILIVDNDQDDHELLNLAFKAIGVTNKMIYFSNGKDAFDFLKTTTDNPFLILSDLKMPKMDGLELRRAICQSDYLEKKAIPFIILSEHANMDEVKKAYELKVQGFFTKPNNLEELQKKLLMIVDYWRNCVAPHKVKY